MGTDNPAEDMDAALDTAFNLTILVLFLAAIYWLFFVSTF